MLPAGESYCRLQPKGEILPCHRWHMGCQILLAASKTDNIWKSWIFYRIWQWYGRAQVGIWGRLAGGSQVFSFPWELLSPCFSLPYVPCIYEHMLLDEHRHITCAVFFFLHALVHQAEQTNKTNTARCKKLFIYIFRLHFLWCSCCMYYCWMEDLNFRVSCDLLTELE